MLKLRILLAFVLMINLLGCKSTTTIVETNALKEIVPDKNFEFIANSAIPMAMANVRGIESLLPVGSSIASINLIGNQNFFIMKNDTLHIDMPYYGIRNMGGSYNSSDVGIKFKGKIEASQITYNSKKKSCNLKYNVKNKQENLKITLTLYPNNSGNLNVISSHRNSINYRGSWKTN